MMPMLLAIVVVLLAGLRDCVGCQGSAWIDRSPMSPEGDRACHPKWVDQHDYG
jgi:hypothetical protein